MRNKNKSTITQNDIIELTNHLRREDLFIACEKKNINKLHEKILEKSREVFHLSWNIRKQKINFEKLISSGKECNPSNFCLNAQTLDNIIFIEASKKLGEEAKCNYSSVIFELRKNPKLIAYCLTEGEANNSKNVKNIINIIISSLYGDCILLHDRSLVLQLLKQLLFYQIANCDNPRRLLRHGSCAFSQVYKIFSENLTATKLFLISALRDPIINLLMEDDLFLDIDPERAAVSFARDERLRHFGQEGTPAYSANLKKYRDWTIDKLSNLALKFIEGIKNSIYYFPDDLCWLIKQIYSTLINSNKINVSEAGIICADLIFGYFICHAIVNPEIYGLIDTQINHIARFNLVQIAQIIQALAMSKWEELDPKLNNLYSKFPKDCITSLMEFILNDYALDHSPEVYLKAYEVSRVGALITEHDLYDLMKFFFSITKTSKDEEMKKVLYSILSPISEHAINNLSASNESQPSNSIYGEKVNLNESIRSKRSILNRVTRRKSDNTVTDTPSPDCSFSFSSKLSYLNTEVLEFGFSNSRDFQLLSEEKIFEQQRRKKKVRMNLEKGALPNEETESVLSSSVVSETTVEKRTRFSLSQDQESIGTSDNLEAISEAASNQSVASSLDLENENENDNFSDMVSANVSSGRGTPNVSGRETSSSGSSQRSKDSSDEENEDVAGVNKKQKKNTSQPCRPLLNFILVEAPNRPNNRDDIEEKFGKFDCKQTAPADETKSLLSDTWSTDVLASDSEAFALDQSLGATNASSQASGFNYLTSQQSLPTSNFSQTALEVAETASQSDAWSTDVLTSDTERLQEFDLDETGSITRSEDSNTARLENDSDEHSSSGAVGGISENQKLFFFEDELSKDGTLKLIHHSNSTVDSFAISATSVSAVDELKDNSFVEKPTSNKSLIPNVPLLKVEITDYDNFLSNLNETNHFLKSQSTLNNRMQTLGRLSFDVRKMLMTEEERISQILPLLREKMNKQPNLSDKEKFLNNQISLAELLSCKLSEQDEKKNVETSEDFHESLIDFEKEILNLDNQEKDSEILMPTKKLETCSNGGSYTLTHDKNPNGLNEENRSSVSSSSTNESLTENADNLNFESKKKNVLKKSLTEESSSVKLPDFLFSSTGAIPKVNKKTTNSNRLILRNSNSLDEDTASRNKKGFFKLPNLRSTIREKMKSLKDKRPSFPANAFSTHCETVQNGIDDIPSKYLDETSDEILEKYRDKRGSQVNIEKSVDSSARFPNSLQESQLFSVSNVIDESITFENTKRLFRNVLSRIDVQLLPLSSLNTFHINVTNEKHIELIRFVKTFLAEAKYMQNSSRVVALQEAIRRLESFDEKSCQKLFWSIREDYQRRSPYIAYLIKYRQILLSTLARFENILLQLVQDKMTCNVNLVYILVKNFLENKERNVQYFINRFQKLTASDEKPVLVDNFIKLYLFKAMKSDPIWQIANDEQIDLGKEAIERYVMGQIYLFALYPNGDGDVLRDQIIQQHMANLSRIISPNHKDLRIPEKFHSGCPWPAAQEQILAINAYRTPRDKLNCVVRCLQTITDLLHLANDKCPPSADDVIPVLVFVLIKANPSSLLSNVQYVSSFYEMEGQEDYCWTQFSSAVEFVKTMDY